jgi:hypothetical protein
VQIEICQADPGVDFGGSETPGVSGSFVAPKGFFTNHRSSAGHLRGSPQRKAVEALQSSATAEKVVLRPQFPAAVKWTILSVMLATAVILGYANGAAWYGQLFRGASQPMRFVIGFAISTAVVASVALFGFRVIWQTFAARNTSEQTIEALHDGNSAQR